MTVVPVASLVVGLWKECASEVIERERERERFVGGREYLVGREAVEVEISEALYTSSGRYLDLRYSGPRPTVGCVGRMRSSTAQRGRDDCGGNDMDSQGQGEGTKLVFIILRETAGLDRPMHYRARAKGVVSKANNRTVWHGLRHSH